MSNSSSNKSTSHGSCHCGAVQFTVEHPEFDKAMRCNCSFCKRVGMRLVFLPAADVQLEQGEDKLTDYQFGKKSIHHPFCSVCGVRPYSHAQGPDGTEMVGVNIRCLDGVDAFTVPIHDVDGASF